MNGFCYVYILESERNAGSCYIGFTTDLRQRLKAHNAGLVRSTTKDMPWAIRSAVAFRDRYQALRFERYLKSGSGRAFYRERL